MRERQFSIGDRLTFQVVKAGERVEVQPVNRDDVPEYWGYRVVVEEETFGHLLEAARFDLTIASARIGEDFNGIAGKIGEHWHNAERVLVAFGAPARGLHEIVHDEGLRLEKMVDFVVNTIPHQGTATVRTEEALLASLAIFNVNFNW